MSDTPSLELVLDSFSVEDPHDEIVLQRYLARFPQWAEDIQELHQALLRVQPIDVEEETAEDLAYAKAAWQRHIAARPPAETPDPLALSASQQRHLAKLFRLPQEVFFALKTRKVTAESVPLPFLQTLGAALKCQVDLLLEALKGPGMSTSSYKAQGQPDEDERISFEQLLIEEEVPEAERARWLREEL